MKATHSFFWFLIAVAIVLAALGIALGGEQAAASGWVTELFAGAIRGSGKIRTEIRGPGDFNCIAISYAGTIIVQQGDNYRITVEADDNLLPQLVTDVRDGVLAIENSEGNYFKRVVPSQASRSRSP